MADALARVSVPIVTGVMLPGCPQLMDDDFRLQSAPEGDAGPDAGRGPGRMPVGPAGMAGPTAPADKCADGVMSPDEISVDCGGPKCPPCTCSGTFGEPEVVITGLGLPGNFYGPALLPDSQTLYFSRERDGDEDLFRSARDDRGSVFSDPVALGDMNTATLDGSPFVTPDSLTLYFFSDRAGGVGQRDIWTASRASADEDFALPMLVANVNSEQRDYFPWLSANRLALFFTSDRAEGAGGHDIWIAERRGTKDAFTAPRNLSELNTSANEVGMTLSRDGLTIIFASDRSGGEGDTDLWLATRSDPSSAFASITNLSALNSPEKDDEPKLSNDGSELFFSSTRDNLRHLWRATRNCD
jgi:Tol biopolymer transport system component